MIPDLATLKTMPGSAVLAALSDALLYEASRVRGMEEALIRIGHATAWDEGRAQAHHAMCGAAEIIDRLRAAGEDAKARGAKPSPLVQIAADVARSMLITERMRQEKREATDAEAA